MARASVGRVGGRLKYCKTMRDTDMHALSPLSQSVTAAGALRAPCV